MIYNTLFVLFLLAILEYSDSLECYSCSAVANLAQCNTTIVCSDHQACYHNETSDNHSLGCVDIKKCGSHASVPTIVGRCLVPRTMSACFECCNTDHCNPALCRHPEPRICMDDETLDCSKLNSIFNICNDKAHAQNVCAKFCGLCIVDGNWTLWSSWSQCDVTCGNGHQTRTRTCTNPTPQNGGLDCVGDSVTTKFCHNDSPCPVHGGWSDWSHWGTCSVTCGMGQERRTRTWSNPLPSLAGNHCFGDNTETQLCMPFACANGGWSDWTTWSTCSVTCGGGIRSKSRLCTNPRPSPYGQYCVGPNARTEICASGSCEINHCTTNPCVHGQCLDLRHDFLCLCNHGNTGRYCNISSGVHLCELNPCNHGTCVPGIDEYTCICYQGFTGRHCDDKIHGGWSDWSHWGTCSVTCGMGQERRTRTCSNPPPSLAGNHCFGANTETQLCMPAACANGSWNDWTTWSTCSATCGGIRSKSRTCTNQRPSPYGQDCVGPNARVEICASGSCEINHCTTNPCVHGQCLDLRHDFLCLCNHGNTGRYCNISSGVHLCELNPCNHGTCVPGIDEYTCICYQGFTGRHCDDKINVTDCYDILHYNLGSRSGGYSVSLWKSKQVIEVHCEMDTDKGGWTVFQNRFDGSVNFTRTLKEYTDGFGSNTGEYWLGDTQGLSFNNGYKFYTYDHDNMYNCAHRDLGGWWYGNCVYANLNGKYFTPGSDHGVTGMNYREFKGTESLKSSRMMFRRT